MATAFAFAFAVLVAATLCCAVGVADALCDAVVAGVEAGAADAALLPDGLPIPPPATLIPWLDVNCGGVIAKTAPRPPTVPPTINSARFISAPSYR